MAWLVGLVFIASLLLGGGAAFASDAAVPGQLLYPLDRSIEELRVSLNRDPAALVELQLAFAEERLAEAQILVTWEEIANFHEALDGYGGSVAAIARVVDSAEGLDREAFGQLLEQALPNHDASLARLAVLDEPEPDDGDEDNDGENSFCRGEDPHPVAQHLADQNGVDIGLIMNWFCEEPGFGFGQIMLALQTTDGDGDSAGAILALRKAGNGWGQIWQELGLIGKPAEVGPPGAVGRPDNVGRPDDAGRPDDVGRPEDAGRPDHAGPPEGVPPVDAPPDDAGPPEGVPPVDAPPDDAGPPDGVPPVDAPPDHAGPPEGVPPVDAPPGQP